MAKAVNGTLRLILTILGILSALAAVAGSYAVLGNDVKEMKPKVQKNTEHRIQFEEKVSHIEETVNKIYDEVRK